MSVIDYSHSLFDLGMKLRQVGRMQIGRLLGSVPTTHGGYKALIDLLERCYFMRAELNAIAGVLISKKIISAHEWQQILDAEMRDYFQKVAADWPEIEFGSDGYTIKDVEALRRRSVLERWPA